MEVDRTPSELPNGDISTSDAVDSTAKPLPSAAENGSRPQAPPPAEAPSYPSPKNRTTITFNEDNSMKDGKEEERQHPYPCDVENGLKRAVLRRQASLSVGEKAFLHALLVDPIAPAPPPPQQQASSLSTDTPSDAEGAAAAAAAAAAAGSSEKSNTTSTSDLPSCHKEQMSRATAVLDDDVLFSLPFGGQGDNLGDDAADVVAPKSQSVQPPRTRRNQSHQIGLWRAHEEGIGPKKIRRLASQKSSMMDDNAQLKRLKSRRSPQHTPKSPASGDREGGDKGDDDDDASASSFGDSIQSDEEVRRDRDDLSNTSSWELSEGGFDHYDAWAVLKDEYADDFGFSYRDGTGAAIPLPDSDEESDSPDHMFKIIGTSADDVSAHPHVLSPPLMDSLLNFVPDSLADQNFWLKFSLVRDGANLDILKRYVRAAPNTILAIETTNGDVFGAFTSSPWRKNPSYFGSGQSFLWKMRYNRMTPCHSLFEQAHLESEIDVYFYSGLNDYVQLCTSDKLAVGGGELDTTGKEEHGDDVAGAPYVYLEEGEHYGFGIAISDDLLHGTSSPCATFRNPCLVNHSSKGEVFEIVNLEIWSLTPCETVDAAEKLEMTKFFVQESVLSSISSLDSVRFSTSPGGPGLHSRAPSTFSGRDLRQEEFYRRVGQEDVDDELERIGWEYQNMMRPGGGGNSMRSPYFASNGSSGPGDLGMHSPRM